MLKGEHIEAKSDPKLNIFGRGHINQIACTGEQNYFNDCNNELPHSYLIYEIILFILMLMFMRFQSVGKVVAPRTISKVIQIHTPIILQTPLPTTLALPSI